MMGNYSDKWCLLQQRSGEIPPSTVYLSPLIFFFFASLTRNEAHRKLLLYADDKQVLYQGRALTKELVPDIMASDFHKIEEYLGTIYKRTNHLKIVTYQILLLLWISEVNLDLNLVTNNKRGVQASSLTENYLSKTFQSGIKTVLLLPSTTCALFNPLFPKYSLCMMPINSFIDRKIRVLISITMTEHETLPPVLKYGIRII